MAIFNRRLFVFFRAPIDRHPLLEVVERLSRKPGHKFDDSSEAFGCLDPPAQPKSGLIMSHKDSLFAVGLSPRGGTRFARGKSFLYALKHRSKLRLKSCH